MGIEYAKTGTAIKPFQLPDEVLLNMARIVRACAEIEDIITLHLNKLADLTEGQSVLLLSRMPVSAKLTLASTLAKVVGKNCVAAHNACFGDAQFADLMRCRNTIAHGLLLGQTADEGKLAFRTVDVSGADEGSITVNVISYELDDFRKYAELAIALVPYQEATLKLEALRKTRRVQDLLPHRKAQKTRKPSVERQRQRKPPPG